MKLFKRKKPQPKDDRRPASRLISFSPMQPSVEYFVSYKTGVSIFCIAHMN